MATIVGDAAIRIGGDITDLKAAMSEGSRSVGSFSNNSSRDLKRTAKAIAGIGTAAIAAGSALVAGLYSKGATVIDQQAKLARSMDTSVVSIQSLDRAAKLAGVSQDGLANASGKLNARLGEAMRGTGQAAAQLDRLNLSAQDLARMEADERLAAIADRMKELNFNSAQAGDALKQFGIREEEIVGMMLQGGDAFRSARQEVNDFGLAVTDIEAAQIEAANDAMTAIGETIQAVSNRIAVELAPYIQEIGDRLGSASKEAGGFQNEISTAVSVGVAGIGKFANVLHGVRVAFKAVQVVASGFGGAVVSVAQLASEAFAFLVDGVARDVNKIIEQLNKLPNVDIAKIDMFSDSAFMQGLRKMGDESRAQVGVLRAELHALAMEKLPSENVEEFLAAVKERAREAAESVSQSRDKMLGGATGVQTDDSGDSAKKDESLKGQLDKLREQYMGEAELLVQKYQTEEQLLAESLERKLITQLEYDEREKQSKQSLQDSLNDIEKRAAEQRMAIAQAEARNKMRAVSNALSDLSTLMNSENKKQFEIGKRAAIANTVIETYTSAQRAFSAMAGIPYVGPVLGAAAAAAAIAAGYQRVSAIKSQSFGGGGAGAQATGSNTAAVNAASTPVGGGASGGGAGTLSVEGLNPASLFTGEQTRELANALLEHQRNGGEVLIA